jgi:hypothetical protein
MATPRKRPSTSFSQKSKEDSAEKQEVEEFLDAAVAEVLETTEKVEETLKADILPEIIPTEDPGPRFIEVPVVEKQPQSQKPEVRKPKRHPRNIPRFSRATK